MSRLTEHKIRDRVVANGGILTVPLDYLLDDFGVAEDQQARKAVATLLAEVGIGCEPRVTDAPADALVTLRSFSQTARHDLGPSPPAGSQVVVPVGKGPGVAALLAFFFGPLGMLYSTILGALLMAVVWIGVLVFTFGLGLPIVHAICAVWAAIAASSYNAKLARRIARTP